MGLFPGTKLTNQWGLPAAYDAQAMAAAAPQPISQVASGMPMQVPDAPVEEQPRPGLFRRMGVNNVGDALSGLGELVMFGPAAPVVWASRRRHRDADEREQRQLLARKAFEALVERNKPQYTNNGNSWLRYDPAAGGGAEEIYRTPSDEEQFATDLNLAPGSKEYLDAIRDKGLGAQGPTNMRFREKEFKDQSSRGWAGLNETRRHHGVTEAQGWRTAGEVTPSKVIGPILAKIAGGKPLTGGEQQALDRYKTFDPVAQMIASAMNGGGGAPPALPMPAPRPAPRVPPRGLPRNPAATTGGPVRVRSIEEARALKPGTRFVTPDGREKIR